MLWRIKGLSNQFVYFNDDIFLLRKITPTDWFIKGRIEAAFTSGYEVAQAMETAL
jgi:predicted NAD/FAD-dependent oxidoreductase